jgi:hypothetical protein
MSAIGWGAPLLIATLVTAAAAQLEARVPLSQEDQPDREEGTHNYADCKNSQHHLCSPASINGAPSHDLSMAERQILCDAVNVGWCEDRRLSQRPAAFGAFPLKQMAPACPVKQHFAVSGDLETFGY